MQRLLTALAIVVGLAGPALAGQEPYLGEIMTTAASFCPSGYLVADGSLQPVQQNYALFSLLGTTYGGDGVRTYALPNMKPVFTATRATVLQCIAVSGAYPPRP